MATTTTVRALRRNEHHDVPTTSSGGNTQGDIVAVGDGRIGIVPALEAVLTGEAMALAVTGQFDILKNSASDTYAVGAAVYFDSTNKVAKTTHATGYLYAGRCVKASTSSDSYVYTDINVSVAPRVPVAAITAAGSTQANAAPLIEGLNVVTGADGTKGVVLPTAAAGMIVYIKGATAGVLKVWPASGAGINGVGADTAMSLASGLIPAVLIASSATQWYTIPLLPS